MKRFILITTLLIFKIFPVFSQPGNGNQIISELQEKLYLPGVFLNDSTALAEAVPQIANQVLASLVKKGTLYYRQASTYYLLIGKYKKASDAIDSVRKAEDDPSWRTYFKIYALAKINDNTEGKLFKQI